MSSTPLTDRIEALTASANAVTGESDTTLTDAVERLMAGYNDELYSIGTEVITRYIGRDSNARGNFYVGRINTSTGEMWYETDDDYPSTGTTYAVSKVYIPVDSSYSFTRGLGFLYFVFYYDENKNFISYAVPQPNTIYWIDFPPLPVNAKYMRLAIHSSMSYRNTIVVRTA